MNINDMYPSKYIKSEDLQGQQVEVTCMSVTIEEVGDKEHKPVMRFMGKDKGMVLNKTNALACASVWGDDTNAWGGQRATLMAAPVMFQGKQVMGLQMLPKLGAPAPAQAGGFVQPAPMAATPLTPAGAKLEALAADITKQEHAVDPLGTLDDLPF
jgi:hypothetical protein